MTTPFHPANRTSRKSLNRLAADPRVKSIHSEGADGYFVTLADGYNFEGQCSYRGERVKDLYADLAIVEKGECY